MSQNEIPVKNEEVKNCEIDPQKLPEDPTKFGKQTTISNCVASKST